MSATTRSLGDTAARGTGVIMSGQAVRVVMQFGATIVMARLLTPGDFGLIAMVVAVVGISEMLRDFGLSSAAIQARHLSDGERTNLFWANTALGAGAAGVMCAISPLIVRLYGQPRLGWVVVAMSTTFVISGANTQFKAGLTRSLRFRALVLSDVVGVASGFAAGILSAVLGLAYWSIVVQQVTTAVVTLSINVVSTPWRPGRPRRDVSIRRFVRFGLGVLGTQAVSYVTRNIDSIGIGIVWGKVPLGLYDRAFQLLMTPLNQVNAPMTRVALPILSRTYDQPKVFARHLAKAQLVGCYLTATVLAVAAALATPLVLVLFGPQWRGVAGIFAALAIGGVFRSIAQLSYWMYLATAKTGAQLKMFLAVRPFMIALILGGLRWGPLGVAIGGTLAYALHWVVSLWRVGVVTGIDTRPLFGNAVRIVATVSAPAGLLAYTATWLPVPDLVQLVCGAAFALAWVVAIGTVVPSARRDLVTILTFVAQMVGGGGLFSGLARDRGRKQALATLLAGAAGHLRPGRWVLVSGSLAVTAGSPAGRVRAAVAAARSPKERLVLLRARLAGPRSVRVGGGGTATGGATEVRLTKADGLIAFDRAHGSVVHIRNRPLAPGYSAHRDLLSTHLPNPSWSLAPDRTVLTERLAAGTLLAAAPLDTRLAVARSVVEAYTRATAAGRTGDAAELVTDAVGWAAAVAGVSAVAGAELTAVQHRFTDLAGTWPLVLSHGDLTALNLLVAPDGSWSAIDFEDAGLLPYFHDSYSLLLRDPDLMASLHHGDLDATLRSLHAAAGVPPGPGGDDHGLYLRATALLAAARHARAHGGTAATLERLWPTGELVGSADGR